MERFLDFIVRMECLNTRLSVSIMLRGLNCNVIKIISIVLYILECHMAGGRTVKLYIPKQLKAVVEKSVYPTYKLIINNIIYI